MTPRRKRSKKRSAANSIAAERLKGATLYLDQSIYSKVLLERMREAGANVEHAGSAFASSTQDHVWLEGCGKQGWIVLNRDERIRYRRLEIEALRDHGVAAFCFTGGNVTAEETADIIVPLIQKFVNMSISEPKPFLYTFGRSGRPNPVKLR